MAKKTNAAIIDINVNDAFGSDDKVQPLTKEAFTAWNSAAMRAMHFIFKWESIRLRAAHLGRPLEVADLVELFHRDPTAPTDTVCAVCGRSLEPYVALVVDQNTGDLLRDRRTGEPLERGSFVVRKQADASMRPEAFCSADIGRARDITVKGELRHLPAQSFAQASAKADAQNANFAEKRSQWEKYHDAHERPRTGNSGSGMTFGDPRVGTSAGEGKRRGGHNRLRAEKLGNMKEEDVNV